MFDLLASLLAWFYSIAGSYGLAILALTLTIMVVFTPLIFRSTKSMIGMRKVQPKIKKLQKRYKDDRETLNKKTMEVYQQHGVNPVGGCLPLFFQAPVFLVMYRVIRGLTRRTLETGYTTANATTKAALARSGEANDIALEVGDAPLNRFNPQYIDPSTDMYQDLVVSNEMNFLGIDLSRTTTEMFASSPASALPYVGLVFLVGALSLFQHRQIQGRMKDGAMNPQMELITKLMPWFLPVFALGMPAALCIYFMGQSVVRVGQQAYITRRFYGDDLDDDVDDDDDDDDDFDYGDDDEDDAGPGGLLGQLMSGTAGTPKAESPSSRHGSRRPVSVDSNRSRRSRTGQAPAATSRTTPKATAPAAKSSAKSSGRNSASRATAGATTTAASEGGSLWSKARRRAENLGSGMDDASSSGSGTASGSEPRTSKRVTPKGGSTSSRKKRK